MLLRRLASEGRAGHMRFCVALLRFVSTAVLLWWMARHPGIRARLAAPPARGGNARWRVVRPRPLLIWYMLHLYMLHLHTHEPAVVGQPPPPNWGAVRDTASQSRLQNHVERPILAGRTMRPREGG